VLPASTQELTLTTMEGARPQVGLLIIYVLRDAVDRVVDHLATISKQLTMTPQEKETGGNGPA
jgi:hypothetical protein